MNVTNLIRTHWAALRAVVVFTVLLGGIYPVAVWLIAMLPGLHDKAQGSVLTADGKAVGSSLIGQLFTDADGNPLPQYFQTRPSAAGDGYDTMATSASNLGPEDVVDVMGDPSLPADDNDAKTSLLTQVCTRSAAVATANGLPAAAGARPFCTGGGVGAVLSVIGPRDASGQVTRPTRVISVNEPCTTTSTPFLSTYEGVRVECATFGEDYSMGQIVPIRGAADGSPVPADAVTASGSGLDPDISPAYADLQVDRVAAARGISPERVRTIVAAHTTGRTLGFMGEPSVNVLAVNLALDGLDGAKKGG